MFTDQIRVVKLNGTRITPSIVSDVNDLLRKQHGRAEQHNVGSLTDALKKVKVVVASHGEKIIGMAALATSYPLSHTIVRIHNLVVLDHYDATVISMRMIAVLVEDNYHADYIEMEAHGVKPEMAALLEVSGFVAREKQLYRRKK